MALYHFPSHHSLPVVFAESYSPRSCFISLCSHPPNWVNVHTLLGRVCPLHCLFVQPVPTKPTLQHSTECLPFARDIWILICKVKTGPCIDQEIVLELFGMYVALEGKEKAAFGRNLFVFIPVFGCWPVTLVHLVKKWIFTSWTYAYHTGFTTSRHKV